MITIWHNPACGTSRTVLAMIRAAGHEPTIVAYLETPPDHAALTAALARLQIAPRDLLRKKAPPYAELGLDDPAIGDGEIIAAMLAHPILIERPVVFTPKGARLCRPAERVQDLLERADP